jgi:hypothetical protein
MATKPGSLVYTDDIRKQRILKNATDSPEYNALAEYLMSRRAMPEMDFSAALGDTRGRMEYPSGFGKSDVPSRGRLSLNWRIPEDRANSTISHEMTHAAHNEWGKQMFDISRKLRRNPETVTTEERQFYDAYQKIFGTANPNSGIAKLVEGISPSWGKSEARYRASNEEVLPFGVGNVQRIPGTYTAPAHIDTTAATEAMILNELATRAQLPVYNKLRGR